MKLHVEFITYENTRFRITIPSCNMLNMDDLLKLRIYIVLYQCKKKNIASQLKSICSMLRILCLFIIPNNPFYWVVK